MTGAWVLLLAPRATPGQSGTEQRSSTVFHMHWTQWSVMGTSAGRVAGTNNSLRGEFSWKMIKIEQKMYRSHDIM